MHAPLIVPDGAALAALIADGATIALAGSGGGLIEPDAVLAALEQRFLATGHPRDLTVIHALGIGDGRGSGLGRLAHEGMVRRVIGGHWSWSPAMQKLAREEKIAAYSLPAGVISTLLRESGAGRPGLFTRIGLGTFVDPALDGGRVNASAREALVERAVIDGRDYLHYKPLKVDVAIIRGSAVDSRGSLTLADEPADLDVYAVALAARGNGGKVIAQVRTRLAGRITPTRLARIPGVMVDAVFLVPGQQQSALGAYDARLCGAVAPFRETGEGAPPPAAPEPEGLRRIIAARALQEIAGARSVNFGFGIPGGIPALARGLGVEIGWCSVEQGTHNGALLDGALFGTARDADAVVASPDQFDFYGGGGIDTAVLGLGEMDADGNVNVSRLGGDIVGPGGFIDISQSARKVVFCGAFEARGLEVAERDGRIAILKPGSQPKLVERVRHVTFSGPQALRNGQEVVYITERAVFRLTAAGVELSEVAPGIDPVRDVLERMAFAPVPGPSLSARLQSPAA
ncbi:CoA-transferase [Pseudoxanthobacter sp.]|uniref:CoA-transferase n=1 Tax=Pseudoxanthobacter sp. TaxID=1925742 RepID=UPI002FE36B9E